MATIENTITPDSTLEKTNKRISGFDINSTLHEATKNKFKLCNGEEKDNDTILHFTKDNFVTLNGRLYGTGGGFYYLNPLYEKMNNGTKLTNETDGDNFMSTHGLDNNLAHVYYVTSDNKTVFIDTLKKSSTEIFQIKTTNDGIRYYRTVTKSSNTNIPWTIESYQRIHKELGNFGTEQEALDALAKVEICGNKDIVHVHLTYGGYANIIMIQSIENNYCRQIIFNKSKLFQRAIYFKDSARTQISYKEDWSFLFGDRLKWDCSKNKYLLSQFEGPNFNDVCTNPIPTANDEHDGLMSRSDKVKLDTLSTPSIVTSSKNGLMPYILYNSIYQPCTANNPGYMESWQYNHLEEAYINSAHAYDLINTTITPNVEYIMSSVAPLTFTLSAKVDYIETTTIPSILNTSVIPLSNNVSTLIARVNIIEESVIPRINSTLLPLVTTINDIPNVYSKLGHTHDDRYYTTNQIEAKLTGKSNEGHTHDDRYYTKTEINTKLNNIESKISYITNWLLKMNYVEPTTVPTQKPTISNTSNSIILKFNLLNSETSPKVSIPNSNISNSFNNVVVNSLVRIWDNHLNKFIYQGNTYTADDIIFDLTSYKYGTAFYGYAYVSTGFIILNTNGKGTLDYVLNNTNAEYMYDAYCVEKPIEANDKFNEISFTKMNDYDGQLNCLLGNVRMKGNGGTPYDLKSWNLCLASPLYKYSNGALPIQATSSDVPLNGTYLYQNIECINPVLQYVNNSTNNNYVTYTKCNIDVTDKLYYGKCTTKYKIDLPKNSGITSFAIEAYTYSTEKRVDTMFDLNSLNALIK